jgi:hypothetical protein
MPHRTDSPNTIGVGERQRNRCFLESHLNEPLDANFEDVKRYPENDMDILV